MKTLQYYKTRQLELKKIMERSDAYASKCYKLGISFAEKYPDKFAEYTEANAEYNENEIEMQVLLEADNKKATELQDFINENLRKQRKRAVFIKNLKKVNAEKYSKKMQQEYEQLLQSVKEKKESIQNEVDE